MTRTADDFLVEIGRKPDDDALKAVFADWLLERGDPRGELMALQLKSHRTDEDLSREALLLKANVRSWLPDEVLINLVPSSIVFEKGVFAAARVSVRSQSALTASLSHPAWGTVRRLSGAPLELIERCPVIEELTELDEATITGLAQRGRGIGRLSTIGVVVRSPGELARAFESPSVESVRELRLGFPDVDETRQQPLGLSDLGWLFRTALCGRLQRLVLQTGWLDLATLLNGLELLETRVPELQLTPMTFEPTSWWVRFSHQRRRVIVHPGSELNASFSEGPVRELLATAPNDWFEGASLPEGWASVRRLPCFRRVR